MPYELIELPVSLSKRIEVNVLCTNHTNQILYLLTSIQVAFFSNHIFFTITISLCDLSYDISVFAEKFYSLFDREYTVFYKKPSSRPSTKSVLIFGHIFVLIFS